MIYRSEVNIKRVQRGLRAIRLHPDVKNGGVDEQTAATDIIADILHYLNASLTAAGGAFNAQGTADCAVYTFEGDLEDEPDDDCWDD